MVKEYVYAGILVLFVLLANVYIEYFLYADETEIVVIEAEKIPTRTQRKVVVDEIVKVETKPELISLGEFKVTAYCSCEKCCGRWAQNRPGGIVYGASGEVLIPSVSIATDTSVIPYGETVVINGNEYVSHDCGGAIDGNRIDIYMGSHEEALEWGVQYFEVFRKGE